MKPIEKAIKTCGTQAKLASAIGVTQAAVSKWLSGSTIRAEYAVAIELATNSQVTRADLRPDLFGTETAA